MAKQRRFRCGWFPAFWRTFLYGKFSFLFVFVFKFFLCSVCIFVLKVLDENQWNVFLQGKVYEVSWVFPSVFLIYSHLVWHCDLMCWASCACFLNPWFFLNLSRILEPWFCLALNVKTSPSRNSNFGTPYFISDSVTCKYVIDSWTLKFKSLFKDPSI